MLMVIFGAGASYDSISSLRPASGDPLLHPNRPPLADELFQVREPFGDALSRFPRCHPIVPYLQSIPKDSSLEHELEKINGEAVEIPDRRLPQLAAVRYYLQFIFHQLSQSWVRVGAGPT